MGIIHPYFPTNIALQMAKMAKAETFVETGTYEGRTAKWAAIEFRNVFTIELSEQLYNLYKDELLAKGNITPRLGNSKEILPDLFKIIDGNIIFWLDAHYSYDNITAGADDPCPLRDELKIILKRRNDDIIIIDDARLFTGGVFPSIVEIYKIANETAEIKRHLQVCNDHIYIVPDKDEYKYLLLEYLAAQDTVLWGMYLKCWNIYSNWDSRSKLKKIMYSKLKEKRRKKIELYPLLLSALKKIGLYSIARKIKRAIKG